MEDDLHLSIGLMSEAIATSFGYDDVDSMLTDDAFTLEKFENLVCVIYEDTAYLKNLKDIISKHGESVEEGALFDHLVGTFELIDKFNFIPADSMDDIVKDYIDDTGNFYDLVHDEHVGGATAETNAHSFGVEHVDFSIYITHRKNFKLITMSLYFFICLQIVLMFKSLTPQIDGWQITLNTNI
jgi:hypothetical protein